MTSEQSPLGSECLQSPFASQLAIFSTSGALRGIMGETARWKGTREHPVKPLMKPVRKLSPREDSDLLAATGESGARSRKEPWTWL